MQLKEETKTRFPTLCPRGEESPALEEATRRVISHQPDSLGEATHSPQDTWTGWEDWQGGEAAVRVAGSSPGAGTARGYLPAVTCGRRGGEALNN